MRIKKRDGGYQAFDMQKVQRAVLMAFQGDKVVPDIMPLVHAVMDRLVGVEEELSVETISDIVEERLVDAGHHAAARRYMRYRIRRAEARRRRLKPDPDGLSGYIHIAKYARYDERRGRRELFEETVDRVRSMHTRRWPELRSEIEEAFEYVYQKRIMPSMRAMQFAGEAIERVNERMYNCAFMHISRLRAFQEVFYLLLCGCGVGYSVQWRHVEQLGEVLRVDRSDVYHHTVSDSIEGWADALGVMIHSYMRDGRYPEYNYSEIRGEGAPLVTSGGRAPGHLPLKKMLEQVRSILEQAEGRRLRPIECHDVLCYAAAAVLSGGIRRASLLALFSVEDTEMMFCKARGQFRPAVGPDPGLNAQREMANNSVCLLRSTVERNMFDRLLRVAEENYGDPGFYFTSNLDYGPNPCGEIGMWPVLDGHPGVSFCNLTEVNCAAAGGTEELAAAVRAASFIGTLQAAYTKFEYLGPVTEKIVRRDGLLGVGLTGIMDARWVLNGPVLSVLANVAVQENKRTASMLDINPAARVCTVKPSGTASLELGGVGSGIHPRWARRYIHRVTANPLEPQAIFWKKMNPHMVEEKPNGDWALMFPIECSDNAITVREIGALEFLRKVLLVYRHWILGGTVRAAPQPLTHNVSCTITVKPSEVDAVIDALWENRDSLCAATISPSTIDRKFRYAPRQAILDKKDEALWNHLIELYRPVDWSAFVERADSTNLRGEAACAGGMCEV